MPGLTLTYHRAVTEPAAAPGPHPGLHDRKRRLMRAEICRLALRLLVHHGYESTTVDQIARAAGLSRRTFFRYFPSKEDVVVGYFDEIGAELGVHLAGRPPGEAPMSAIRNAFAVMIERYAGDRQLVLEICRLAERTPALRARHVDKQDRWQSVIATVVAQRTGAAPHDMAPRLLAAVAIGAFDVALRTWVDRDGDGDLAALVDEALDTLSTTLARPRGRRRLD